MSILCKEFLDIQAVTKCESVEDTYGKWKNTHLLNTYLQEFQFDRVSGKDYFYFKI